MFNRFYVLLSNTILKEYRSKTLIVVYIITAIMIILVNSGIDLLVDTVKDQVPGLDLASQKMTAFYFIITSWTGLLALLMGLNSISSDVESNSLNVVLSYPIKRSEYLLARFLGTSLLIFSYYLFSVILASAIFSFSSGTFEFSYKMILGLIPLWAMTLSTISICGFIGLFGNKIISFLISAAVLIFINASNSVLEGVKLSEHFSDFGIFRFFSLIFYWFFPHNGALSSIVNVLLGGKETEINYAFEAVHFIFAYAFLFFLISFFFKRKEI